MININWRKQPGPGWSRFQRRFLEPTSARLDPEERLRASMLTAFVLLVLLMFSLMAMNEHAPMFRRWMVGIGAVVLASVYTLRWTKWHTLIGPVLVGTVMTIPLMNVLIGGLDPNDSLKWLAIPMLTGGLWLTVRGTTMFFVSLLVVLLLMPLLNAGPAFMIGEFLRGNFPSLALPEWREVSIPHLAQVFIFAALVSFLILTGVMFQTRARLLIRDQKVLLEEEVAVRKDAQAELVKHRNHLEELVAEKTAQLQEHQRIIEGIMNHSPAVIYVKDEAGRYMMVNKQFREMFGLSAEDILGRTDHDIFRKKEADEYRKNDLEVLEAGTPIESEEIAIVKGAEHQYISQKFPMKISDSEVLVAGISTDITMRKVAEENLRVALEEISALKERLQDELTQLHQEIDHRPGAYEIVGESKAIRSVFALIDRATKADTTVLIHGETGTGKELIARAIHKNSPRASKPFITVDCTSLPETLVESELFGHEKGAFTGAAARKLGKFEAADGGTIFLDEIGEMRFDMQARLLRVLNDKTITRVGATSETKIDVQVIAATNRKLDDEVSEGRFRNDLFFRLNVLTIESPPLRQRKEDIEALVWHFIGKYRGKFGNGKIGISQAALDDLKQYHWPGNIRQLEHTIEVALQATQGDQLNLAQWRQGLDSGSNNQSTDANDGLFILRPLRDATNEFRKTFLKKHKDEWSGSGRTQKELADRLGVRDTHLSKLLHDYGIA
ncbi:MAG: sigma 54-interacting transcriptional regulator [Ignavibacteria bacterium]|nr:sigma 54-interacting transcriptional regulator [Ignavibacteria bacterium]